MSAKSLTFMSFYSGLAVGISVVSAVGVYLSPLINDRIKRLRDSREMHKQQLVKHVLKPLIRQIGYFLFQEIAIREDQDFKKISEEWIKKYTERKFDFVGTEPIYSSLEEIGNVKDEWYDSDLFSDLENHFPELAKEVGRSRATVTTSMPTYVKLTWQLVGELDDLLRPQLNDLAQRIYDASDNKKAGKMTGEDLERGRGYTRIGIIVALMKLFFYPTEQWPNLLEMASKIDGLISNSRSFA